MPRKPKITPEQLAAELSKHVLTGKPIAGTADTETIAHMSRTDRAQIMQIIGPDVEAFRAALADKMIVVAAELTDAIRRDIAEMKPESRAFALCAVTDKSELLRARLATSAKGAQVNVQINAFGDGTFDRNALLASLAGNLAQTVATAAGNGHVTTVTEPIPLGATPQAVTFAPRTDTNEKTT